MSKKKSNLWEWVESILIAFVLAMVIRTFVIQAFKIPTGSMRMTLLEGDAILVNIFPQDTKKDFIKRLVGIEGDSVEIINGTIYVNDKPVVEQGFNSNYYWNRGEFGEAGKKIKVPANSYFVLGDNSASSQDSRYWGFVPKDNMLGKAILIYWPLHRIRLIK